MPKHEKYPTWQTIHQYVKDRVEGLREHEISKAIHQGKSSKKYLVHAFTNKDGVEEDEHVASQKPQPVGPSNQDLADMILAMKGERSPSKSPKGSGKGKGKEDEPKKKGR